jgi:flavin reductase (DIM6/NTAB) family NADH-FMN oxidoreductase RutF
MPQLARFGQKENQRAGADKGESIGQSAADMTILTFKGFGGVRLTARATGLGDDPAVLIIHAPGQSRKDWEEAAHALEQAGRRVINLDLRGSGESEAASDGRADEVAQIEDIRAVLAQLGSRPVVVAVGESGWFALGALAQDAVTLAAGLVLVDLAGDQTEVGEEPAKAIPALMISGDAQVANIAPLVPHAESVIIEAADQMSDAERAEALNGVLIDFLEQRQPRSAPEYRTGSDARTLRDAMGCFATGVTIVTAHTAEGTPIGLTANSFTSVSLDPPLLLVCVANTSSSAVVLRGADHFAVNVLQIGQQTTSNRFAAKAEDRFATTPWEVGETGVPVLTGSLSTFECARDAVHEAGDHFLLVGKVLKASFEPRRDPLLYFRGKYRRLHFA